MPIVSTGWLDASNDNSPHTANISTQVDLARLLSEHYGKQIRQGNSFCVTGVQATVTWADLNNLEGVDTGVACTAQVGYIPSTKHSKKAWLNAYNHWKSQHKLAGRFGRQNRYEDFEVAWDSNSIVNGVTSVIRSDGLYDNSQEAVCLTGSSSSGSDYVIKDVYNSAFPHSAGMHHITNAAFKAPKFGSTPFPETQFIFASATSSAIMTDQTVAGTDLTTYSGAAAFADFEMLPTPIHVLAGVMSLNVFIGPDDTATQTEEDMKFKISFSVKSWKSLFPAKRKRWMYRRKSRRSSYKPRRYYRRKKSRRYRR